MRVGNNRQYSVAPRNDYAFFGATPAEVRRYGMRALEGTWSRNRAATGRCGGSITASRCASILSLGIDPCAQTQHSFGDSRRIVLIEEVLVVTHSHRVLPD